MTDTLLTRDDLIAALRRALEPLDWVQAMWEGGAVSFGRADEWSDMDLQIAVDDERVADGLAEAERALTALAPLELKYELPRPTWHGHAQTFFRLTRTSPFLLIDFVVMKRSAANRFLEAEIHGSPLVHFDKIYFTASPPLDRAALLQQIEGRLTTLRSTFPLFQTLTQKELERGNAMEAVAFYAGYTLRPLVEVLRIRYCPLHYNFHTRYVYYDLPAEVVGRLEPLFFPASAEELRAKREQAEQWFNAALAGIALADVARALG